MTAADTEWYLLRLRRRLGPAGQNVCLRASAELHAIAHSEGFANVWNGWKEDVAVAATHYQFPREPTVPACN
jgi:hypothetical protein